LALLRPEANPEVAEIRMHLTRGTRHDRGVAPEEDAVVVNDNIDAVDWERAKSDLAADNFDNGRSAAALRRSFENSQHVAFAWMDNRLVGMARMLSDGVCNAYLLDVWTHSSMRRRGIASSMVRRLIDAVPGQHVGLQTDDAARFYTRLGFREDPQFLGLISGGWLQNAANR
jgi:GNAT superfamily N-acetyltransferase